MLGERRVKSAEHEHAVFYHMWSEPNEPPVYRNIRTPIVLSIATLRACNDRVPIYVMDNSKDCESHPHNKCDWGDFPKILNFQIINDKFYYKHNRDRFAGWKHLSRIPDIQYQPYRQGIQVENIIYCDTDVFWLRNPLPFHQPTDKFCFDGWNSGYYYYNRREADKKGGFMDMFKAYTSAAIYSKDVRELMKKYIGYDEWYGVWDEMILTYMFNEHPEMFHRLPNEEHGVAARIPNTDFDEMKMIHFNGVAFKNDITGQNHCRGLSCIVFREYWNRINRVLSKEDISRIFSQEELDFYMPKQTSILEAAKKLRVQDDGHYHINKLWSK